VQWSPTMPSTAAAISSRVVPCHKLKMRCPTGGTVSVQGMTCITATPSGRWPALIAFVRSITGNGTVDVTLSTTDITWTNIVSHANEGYGDGARCVCVVDRLDALPIRTRAAACGGAV